MEVVIGGQIYQMKLDAKGLLEVSAPECSVTKLQSLIQDFPETFHIALC